MNNIPETKYLFYVGYFIKYLYCIIISFIFLISVLKTFLHDPLVEWSKPVKGSSKTQVNESGEILNEKVLHQSVASA